MATVWQRPCTLGIVRGAAACLPTVEVLFSRPPPLELPSWRWLHGSFQAERRLWLQKKDKMWRLETMPGMSCRLFGTQYTQSYGKWRACLHLVQLAPHL